MDSGKAEQIIAAAKSSMGMLSTAGVMVSLDNYSHFLWIYLPPFFNKCTHVINKRYLRSRHTTAVLSMFITGIYVIL